MWLVVLHIQTMVCFACISAVRQGAKGLQINVKSLLVVTVTNALHSCEWPAYPMAFGIYSMVLLQKLHPWCWSLVLRHAVLG